MGLRGLLSRWCAALVLIALGAGRADALTYSWKPSTAVYAPGAGTTITFPSADNGAVMVNLPFTFTYDSAAYNTVGVSSNGLLTFVTSNTSTVNGSLFTTATPFNALAPWWDDLIDDATSTVQSFTLGTTPNRVFVIQYADYPDFWSGTLRLNWQVRLHEGSNRIEFAYGSKGAGTPSLSSTASVGIKGRNSLAGFFFEGTTGSRTVAIANLNSNTGFPAAGTVFTFAPDTAAPLGLTATPGPGRADLVWRPTRLPSILRYRIWVGTSPTTMTPWDSTSARTDTTRTIVGLVNGTRYYVGVTAVGNDLMESGFAQVVTVIPTALPSVSITAPATGTIFPSSGTITFNASASDPDGTIAQVEYYRGGTTLIGSSTIGNPFSVTWSALVTGTHSITARAVDNAGGMTTSAPITVIVNSVPLVSLTGPPTGTLAPPGSDVTLTATASDADGSVARVEFLRDGILLGVDATAPYAHTWTAITTGRYVLTARAVDDRGAATTSASSILIVTVPPEVTITSPSGGAVINPTAGLITLTANATDADGTVSRVDYYRGITLVGSSLAGNPFTVNASAVAGAWTLTARATDNLGAIDTSAAVTFTVNQAPVTSLTNPVAGTYPWGTTFNLAASATDGDGTVALVEFFRDGVKLGEDPASPYGIAWTPDTAGRYALTVRATDNRGAVTNTAVIWITITPYTVPKVTLTSPSHFSAFATGSSISISAAVQSARTITQVSFYRDSILIGTAASGPPYTVAWNGAPAGRYRLQARARDNLDSIGYSQAVTVFVNDSARAMLGGRLFVTGHDADAHLNYEFMSASLDYLLFGKAAGPLDAPIKKGARIAFLGDYAYSPGPILGYAAPTFINVNQAGWETLAFPAQPYDVLMVGSGLDYLSSTGSAAVNAQRAAFDAYFNRGGGILAFTEQGLGQSYYNFLPAFATAIQQSIGSVSGVFTATPAGLAIGLTEAIVDRDLTHTEFRNVDTTVFRIFEFYNADLMPVSIGANAIIEGDIFIPRDSVVADPQAFSRDSVFVDTLCIRFETATPGALIHLTRDGGNPDTSTWTVVAGSLVCIDNSTRFRAIAKKPGWVNSAEKEFRYRRADQVAIPLPDIPGGYFQSRICVRFTSATAGATVRYTLDGGLPDTSGLSKANGDSICVDASRVIRVLGRMTGMRDSDTGSHVYTRMEQTAMPTLNPPDSTWFADSLCFRFSAATSGSHIHYTLDGGRSDTAETHVHDGDSLCVDSSVTVRLMAERTNFIPSAENRYRYYRMDTAAAPVSNRPDSTGFQDTLCLVLSSATPGAAIHYTLDGTVPSTASPIATAGALCIDRTVRLQALAALRNWINSSVTAYTYAKLDTLAAPAANPPGGTDFSGSLCIRFSTNVEGAVLRYTLDGSAPAGSSLLLPMTDSLCIDRTVTIRARAEKANWVSSPEASFAYRILPRVARPTASRGDSTWFADTLCVRFATATDSATLRYLTGSGRADTSSLVIPAGRDLCVDSGVVVRVAATRAGWLPSEELTLRFFKMDTAAVPVADPGDSTWFAGRQCIRLVSATAGAAILYTLDGRDPAVSGLTLAGGDTVCVEDTVTVRALARKQDWVDSRVAAFHYIRMRKVATPVADRRDSTYFADSLCVRFSTATPGAGLRYTVDGSAPDTASPALPGTGALCVDRTVDLRVIATLDRWIPSDPIQVRALKMDTVAMPVPVPGDSTWFAPSVCVRWTVATPGALIRVTADGSRPDSSSRTLASGDTLCLDRTATLRASGAKPDWIPSPDTAAVFLRMIRAATPTADKPDSLYFPDRLCIRYTSATAGVRIHYTLDGGPADTSGLSIANGDTLCVESSLRIRTAALLKNWLPSEESVLQVFRMQPVAVPEAGVADSTWFRDRLCVPWTVSTPGAAITVRGSFQDSTGRPAGAVTPDSAGQVLASGDSVCLDRSATLRAVGSLKDWKDSPEAVRTYFRMDTVSRPAFDRGDTVFHPSICVRVSSGTPGAAIRYTLDGGDPDTSALTVPSGDTICTDRSAEIRALGERKNSVPSEESVLRLTWMQQVAPLRSSIGDTAVFSRRICFTLSSATDSVRIRYTLGGGDPLDDTLSMAGGDTLCLDRSAELVAVGTRPLWRNSAEIRVSLEVDNDGPRLLRAEKHPYNIQNISVSGNCRGIGYDTLVLGFSEPLHPKSNPPRWDRLLLFSASCDSGDGMPVRPVGEPVISRDGLQATLLLDNATADEKPKLGNCLSLDWKSGEFPDRVGNLPERRGVRIEGRENAVRISHLRAYPPVVGLDDARASGSGCSDEGVTDNTWIPPFGFDLERGTIDAREVRKCLESGGDDTRRRESIPPCLSIVEVISDGPYVAEVGIFDHLGNFVHGSRQQFGACGELDNLERSVAGKKRSYLVWNTRDRDGARAGNGVYVWRISFHAEKDGIRGIQTVLVRTGFLRNGVCAQ